MRWVFISDNHSNVGFNVPDGDVLVHCGDATRQGGIDELEAASQFLAHHPHRHKLWIAGNHDHGFAVAELNGLVEKIVRRSGAVYMQDSGVEIEGTRIWGSPWTQSNDVYHGWAFNFPKGKSGRDQARKTWAQIPVDTDILVTHVPPYGLLDRSVNREHLGDRELRDRVKVVKPAIHAFGHVHAGHGTLLRGDTLYVNASICSEANAPSQKAIVVDYCDKRAVVVV